MITYIRKLICHISYFGIQILQICQIDLCKDPQYFVISENLKCPACFYILKMLSFYHKQCYENVFVSVTHLVLPM